MPTAYPGNQATKPARAKAGGGFESAIEVAASSIPAYYIPETTQFISWDAPVLAHTGVDINYKMTAYDWFDRALTWSVTGPAGITIDADGTLHWTPSTDQVSETVTVECSLGGQETLSKTFTCTVDNSRCVFIATNGSDTTGNGSIGSPYATFEKVAAEIRNATTARVVYHRAGTYTTPGWDWFNGGNADLSALAGKVWAETGPLLIRNYPSENVEYQLPSGAGWVFYGSHNVVYGMDVNGGDLNENAGLLLGGKSVGKRMRVYNYQSASSGNCAGIKHLRGSILDQCQAWDNYDRANPDFHNSSNYVYYGTSAKTEDAYVIDCLSDSLGTRRSAVGFKIKHAGDNPPHYHKCADTGTLKPFAGMQGKMTIRKSTFFTSEASKVMSFEFSDLLTSLASQGFLVEGNTIYGAGSAKALLLSWYSSVLTSSTPAYVEGNKIITESSGSGNVLTIGEFNSNTVPAGWDVDYNNNEIYTPSPSNSVVIEGTSSGLSTITSKGAGNVTLPGTINASFSAAGRSFTITNGVCAES